MNVYNFFSNDCPNKGKFVNPTYPEFYLFNGYNVEDTILKIQQIQKKTITDNHKQILKVKNVGNNNPSSFNSITKRLGSVKKAKDFLKDKGNKEKGENNPFYGRSHSNETLIKLAKIRSEIPKIVTRPELMESCVD
jgi:hypothetical protein